MLKKTRSLLIQPPESLGLLMAEGKHFVPAMPPKGLMYIASALEQNGYLVEILDGYVHEMTNDQIVEEVQKKNPNIVGLSCLTANAPNVCHIVREIKKRSPETTVVVGNVHAVAYDQFFIEKIGADIVSRHPDGEDTMLDIVNAIEEKIDFSKIDGISWNKNGVMARNKERAVDKNLDRLAFPAYHLVDFHAYKNLLFERMEKRKMEMVFSSRGCVFECTFCCVSNLRNYRMRSAKNFVDEVEMLVKKYGVREFTFGDPLFTVDKKRVLAICEEIEKRKLNIRWNCEVHVRYADEEVMRTMKKSGCYEVSIGIESGSQKILDSVKKGTKIAQIRESVERISNNGIGVCGLFMIGMPGEKEEDILSTIQFAKSLKLVRAQFAINTPYPGTETYKKMVENKDIEEKDWDDPEFILDWHRLSAYIGYTDNEPLWKLHGITVKRLKELQKKAMREFYFRPQHFFGQVRQIKFTDMHFLKNLFIGAYKSFFK